MKILKNRNNTYHNDFIVSNYGQGSIVQFLRATVYKPRVKIIELLIRTLLMMGFAKRLITLHKDTA